MNDLISIIVPIYKAENWLERCIKSICSQTYQNIEIILINDGSPDNSGKICDRYAKKDSRIKVIHKINEGVSVARNIGIENSKGKFIKFVDSDDWLEEKCCELLINEMEKNNTDLVMCGMNIYKNDILLRTPHLNKKIVNVKKDIKNFEYILKLLASPCNKLYKKNLIKNLFLSDLSSGEDLLFNLNYINFSNEISIIENCLYNVCLDNDNSLNRKFRDDKLDITLNLLDKQKDYCIKTYGKECDFKFLYNKYIENLHAHCRSIYKVYDKQKFNLTVKKYLCDVRIEKASKNCKLTKIDYKIFNVFVKHHSNIGLRLFFRIKYFLVNLKSILTKKIR